MCNLPFLMNMKISKQSNSTPGPPRPNPNTGGSSRPVFDRQICFRQTQAFGEGEGRMGGRGGRTNKKDISPLQPILISPGILERVIPRFPPSLSPRLPERLRARQYQGHIPSSKRSSLIDLTDTSVAAVLFSEAVKLRTSVPSLLNSSEVLS